jgi:GT2 family glycosyltransferase
VPHWNTPDLLHRCVAAVTSQSKPPSTEILVVDNGSTEIHRPRLGPLRGVTPVYNDSNRGFAAACNQAAAIARGRYLLFLNTDVELGDGDLASLVDCLERSPELAAVAPLARRASKCVESPAMHFLNPVNHIAGLLGFGRRRPFARHAKAAGRPVAEVDWLRASTLLVRADVFRAFCGFDEAYFFYEEDEDFSWRLARKGYRVAVCQDVVVNDIGGATARHAGHWPAASLYTGQLRFLGRRFGPVIASAYRVAVSVTLALKFLRARARSLFVSREESGPADSVPVVLRSLWSARKAPIAAA